MAPGTRTGNTTISLDLANATPGGPPPWQLHRGQCGSDQGVFGNATGQYFVIVRASAANNAMTVACGNLVPPTLWLPVELTGAR